MTDSKTVITLTSCPRVMINLLSASTGGGLTYARSLIPLLQKRLACSTVLYSHDLASFFSDGNGGILVRSLLAQGSKRFLWERIHLGKLLRQREIQLLYTPYQVAIQPDLVKLVCALRNLEPFFSRGYRYDVKSSVRNSMLYSLTRTSLARADRIIAVSDFAAEFAVSSLGMPREKVTRVYHGRDESLLKPDDKEDETIRRELGIDGPYVFTAGSLLPYRRVEDVIAAFENSVAPLDSLSTLVIAGSGTDRTYGSTLSRTIAQSPYRSRIRMIGYAARRQMRALYKGCRAFISASEIEACPNIGIEAMTAGCPVIASASGPAEEIYGSGALLYSPRDIGKLSELMMILWREEELRRQHGARAAMRSEMFSWHTCARETADALLSV
jgi:glycosyltransferase involved in cell wall biosynthesis